MRLCLALSFVCKTDMFWSKAKLHSDREKGIYEDELPRSIVDV